MKQKTNRKLVVCTSIVSLLISALTLTSCNPRQARVINKLIHDVDHAVEEGPYQNDNSTKTTNACYSVRGVVQYDNGRVSKIANNSVVLIQKPEGLVLGNDIFNNPVYNNDVEIITEVYDLPDNSEYEYSFGETATRAFSVASYNFICLASDRTYYFNVVKQLY